MTETLRLGDWIMEIRRALNYWEGAVYYASNYALGGTPEWATSDPLKSLVISETVDALIYYHDMRGEG